MTFIAVQCPHCLSKQIIKRGKTRRGTQRGSVLKVEMAIFTLPVQKPIGS